MAITAITEAELADAVRCANGPLCIVGGGTRMVRNIGAAEVLHTSGLSGVTLYEPGALTLVAGAGTPLAEVEGLLANEGQRLPFEVPDMRGLLGGIGASTLGGVVATNASGPRRVQVGACRDSLIGVRFVDGTGTVIKNGGRVMKNVTGYDLVKLMAGSHGTLGVLTEVSFKLLPIPEAAATLMIYGLDPGAAVAAMSAALGSPFEVSGAAHVSTSAEGTSVTFLRIEGFAASVAYRAERLKDLLAGQREMILATDDARMTRQWQSLRDVEVFHGTGEDVWRISVKPSDAPILIEQMPGHARVCLDWGGGLIWAAVDAGTDLRAHLAPFAGHATRVRGKAAPGISAFHPDQPTLAALAKGIRARFDPRGILNPGLM